MSETLSRVQPFIQLEEAMKASFNPSTKPSEGMKSKFASEAPDYVSDWLGGNLPTRSRCSA